MAHFASDADTKVAIIIVTYNADEFVKLCLDSVRHYSTMPHEIIIVDNGSEVPLRQYLRRQEGIKLILSDENLLWAGGNNVGIKAAADDVTHYLLLNSDMEIRRADWLQRLVNLIESEDRIGLVGNAQARTRVWPTFGGVDGQCMLIKRTLTEKIGLLDSEKYPWNGADIDYAARAFKAGCIYKIMPREPELVVHYRGMSRRKKRVARVEQEMMRKDDRTEDILRAVGLRPVRLPRWLYNLYTLLPGRPFFRTTKRQRKIIQGKMLA